MKGTFSKPINVAFFRSLPLHQKTDNQRVLSDMTRKQALCLMLMPKSIIHNNQITEDQIV